MVVIYLLTEKLSEKLDKNKSRKGNVYNVSVDFNFFFLSKIYFLTMKLTLKLHIVEISLNIKQNSIIRNV